MMLNSNSNADVLPSASHDHKPMLSEAVFRPMLFSTPMVEALLAGRKTQTRRICKLQPDKESYYIPNLVNGVLTIDYNQGDENPNTRCPYSIGDIVWVRETWAETCDENGTPIVAYKTGLPRIISGKNALYDEIDTDWSIDNFPSCGKWKPSLFMPKYACRLFLEITRVRVERLHDISEFDAENEGAEFMYYSHGTGIFKGFKNWDFYKNLSSYKMGFEYIWSNINGQKSWNDNPLVWIYDFKLVSRPYGFR